MKHGWMSGVVLVVLSTMAAGCESGSEPTEGGVAESELSFLRFPPDLQPLVTYADSFYAVKGEDRELVLRYQSEEPEEPGDDDDDGEEFLEFRVPDDALLRRPDGSRFEEGDSVLIKVEVSDDGRFLFRFEPSGLQFDPEEAPRLRVTYRRVGGDLDGDGDDDEDDDSLEEELGLWRQEAPGELWYPVGIIKLDDLDEIDGEILGFTGFAIAG